MHLPTSPMRLLPSLTYLRPLLSRYLEKLFATSPLLPGRFFAFLATYEAERLRKLTATFSTGRRRSIAVGGESVPMESIVVNAAYKSVFKQFLTRQSKRGDDDSGGSEERGRYQSALNALSLYDEIQSTFKDEPDLDKLKSAAQRLLASHIDAGGTSPAPYVTEEQRGAILLGLAPLHEAADASALNLREVRGVLDVVQAGAVESLKGAIELAFVSSDYFAYILELKAKEGIVPNVADFRLIRVLGEGGFGQVIEVVKRDCVCSLGHQHPSLCCCVSERQAFDFS